MRELRKESAQPEEGRETNETTILVSKECRDMMSEDGHGETEIEALSKTAPHSLQSSNQRIMSAKMSHNRNSFMSKIRYAHADYTQENEKILQETLGVTNLQERVKQQQKAR